MEPATGIFLRSVRLMYPEVGDFEVSRLASKLAVKELKKKDFFLQSGKIQKAIGFIASGLVRAFFIDQDGNDITVGFYSEGHYATHYPSFIMRQPSQYAIQCLEPTTIVCFSLEDMQLLYQQVPKFERYGRLIVEEILKQQQARIESFIFQTAEERYLDFTRNQPALFSRISLSHLCSYLGIERQTLTRIRQKIAYQ